MNKKTLIVIACSLAAGIIAILLVNYHISKREAELFKGMNLVTVIAVTQDTPAGTQLNAGMLAKRQMPEKYVHGNAVDPKDANLIIGQVVNFPLKRGDPILWTDLRETGTGVRGGLASMITQGERALSIAVDDISGVSGLIKPNDHVDMLCTVRSQETGEEATITLVQNITVLATGASLSGEAPTRRGGGYGTLTLLVTLEEAELLVFAMTKGSLVAILRNDQDIETSKDIPKVTFSDILENEYRAQIQQTRDRIEVIKKGKVQEQK